MINYDNYIFLYLRSLGQKLGVLKPAVKLYRMIARNAYEHRFDSEMMEAVRPGDIVWDVGANIGIFTEKFLKAVGEKGAVVAFEPSPKSHGIMAESFSSSTSKNLVLLQKALGASNGIIDFWSTDNSVTDGLLYKYGAEKVVVELTTADSIVVENIKLMPNIIKIDVEGFEFDVLQGMRSVILKSETLRAIFVEVHFNQSRLRGAFDNPLKIRELMREYKWRIRWIDPSHFVATK